MVSVSQGRGWVERAGLVERGHRVSRQEVSVEQRDSVAASTSSGEKVLGGGKAEATTEAK